MTLLAAYHTAYNIVGVAVLLPLVDRFTRLVERILPERGSPLTRYLDPSALATPVLAVEAVRRTIARALVAVCGSVEAALGAQIRGEVPGKSAISVGEAIDVLRRAQVFLSDVSGPPDTDDEQRRLTSTLHALDHASRLAEVAGGFSFGAVRDGPDELRARQLCADAMGLATWVAEDVVMPPDDRSATASPAPVAKALPVDEALAQLEHIATELEKLQLTHRRATLDAAANGKFSAEAAIVRVDALRSLHALVRHAWRCTWHLAGHDK